jgi:exonuclease SbcD
MKSSFPFCAMVQHRPSAQAEGAERSYAQRLTAAVTDADRIEAFLEHVRAGRGPTERESEIIHEVLDERVAVEALV